MSNRKDQAFAALIEAEEQFIHTHRISRETAIRLCRALPDRASDWCVGQLLGYQGQGLGEDVASLFELSAWRSALKWAGGSRAVVGRVSI